MPLSALSKDEYLLPAICNHLNGQGCPSNIEPSTNGIILTVRTKYNFIYYNECTDTIRVRLLDTTRSTARSNDWINFLRESPTPSGHILSYREFHLADPQLLNAISHICLTLAQSDQSSQV